MYWSRLSGCNSKARFLLPSFDGIPLYVIQDCYEEEGCDTPASMSHSWLVPSGVTTLALVPEYMAPLGLIMYVKNKHPVLHVHTSTEKAKHVGLFGVSSIKLIDEKTVEGQTLKQTNTFPGMWMRKPKWNRAAGSSSMKPLLVKTSLQLYVIFAATPLHPVL